MDVTLLSEYKIVSTKITEEPRQVLKSVSVPLTWRIQVDPQSPGTVKFKYLGTGKQG